MRIAVTGASGFLGAAVAADLAAGGHSVLRLVRSRPPRGADETAWDATSGAVDGAALAGLDALVHLAGENLAAGRWNATRKARIRDSRVHATRALVESLARLDRLPRVLVCASASGWYGDRGDELLHEDSPPGSGFLAELCRDWESAAAAAGTRGVRVVHLRIGVVLDVGGGALARMLPVFRSGLGAPLGSGRQYWPWIALADLVGVVRLALESPLAGAVNAVAPHAVTNREFTRAMGRVLSRPTLPPVPAFALRLALGEMASMLLASQRSVPARLQAAGYGFRHPELEPALDAILGRIR